MKRGRIDGYLTRDNYDQETEDNHDNSVFGNHFKPSGPGTFSRASEGTISVRRKLTASKKLNRKLEYAKHVKSLNQSFFSWFKSQVKSEPSALMINAAQDALDYLNKLSDKYMKSYGEVLTFGNGDCGQLAHG